MYYLLLPVQELLVIFEAFLKELIFLAFYLFDVYLITLLGFSFSGISFLLIAFLKSINASLTRLTTVPLFVVRALYSRSSNLTLFCKSVIYISLSIIKSFNCFFGNILSIRFNSSILLERSKDFKALNCFFVWFSKIYSKREYVNVACCII